MKTWRRSEAGGRRFGAMALAIALSLAIVGLCAWLVPASSAARPGPTTHAGWHDIARRIEATGTLRPTSVVHVGALVSGIIASTEVQPGDRVRAGQVIATIDDDPFRLQLTRARAVLRATQLRADEAARQQARQRDLHRDGFVSEAATETAGHQLDEARADVQAALADVQTAQVNLAHCRILSPIAGTVLSQEIAAGQSVASAFQVPDLFTIVSRLDHLEVVALFAEADLAQVTVAATATLGVPAYPDREFYATVLRILDKPEARQGLVMFPVILGVANDQGLLRPGMTAYVRLRLPARTHALSVPNQALAFARARDRAEHRPSDGRRHLYVRRDGSVQAVAVRLGEADETHTEIFPVDRLDERDDILMN